MSEEEQITQAALDMAIRRLNDAERRALADALVGEDGSVWARGNIRTMTNMVREDMLVWEWIEGAHNPRPKLTPLGMALRDRLLEISAA